MRSREYLTKITCKLPIKEIKQSKEKFHCANTGNLGNWCSGCRHGDLLTLDTRISGTTREEMWSAQP